MCALRLCPILRSALHPHHLPPAVSCDSTWTSIGCNFDNPSGALYNGYQWMYFLCPSDCPRPPLCSGADMNCHFNPCADPSLFRPANSQQDDHCTGDEPGKAAWAQAQSTCEEKGCTWAADRPDDPCHCNPQSVCEAAGATWESRLVECGGHHQLAYGAATCENARNIFEATAPLCCANGGVHKCGPA